MQPVGAVQQCWSGLPGHVRLFEVCQKRGGRTSDSALRYLSVKCWECHEKQSHLRSTTTDSPLELFQENSNVHAPLGTEDGNLGSVIKKNVVKKSFLGTVFLKNDFE